MTDVTATGATTDRPHLDRPQRDRPESGRPRSGPPGSDQHRYEQHGPSQDQLDAWRAFLRAHATITRMLEAELEAEQQLSLAAYDVLVQLAEAPERRLRMTELAEAVLLSRSGVTRLVDRMEKVGLVSRCPVASDGRGVAAQLTDVGLHRLRVASRTHLAGVVRHFAAHLGDDDLYALERISRRLVR